MRRIVALSFLFLGSLSAMGVEPPVVLSSAGVYRFPESGATVTLGEPEAGWLNLELAFHLPELQGSTGTGKEHPVKVLPGHWKAVFAAPNELWIDTGLGTLKLYERTIIPNGFKATDSTVKPGLIHRAPEAVQKLLR